MLWLVGFVAAYGVAVPVWAVVVPPVVATGSVWAGLMLVRVNRDVGGRHWASTTPVGYGRRLPESRR